MAFGTIEFVNFHSTLLDMPGDAACIRHPLEPKSSSRNDSRTLLPCCCCRGTALPASTARHRTAAKKAEVFSMDASRNDKTASCDRRRAWSCKFISPRPLFSDCPQNSVRDGKKPCRNSTSTRRANSLSSLEITRKYGCLADLQEWPRASPPLSASDGFCLQVTPDRCSQTGAQTPASPDHSVRDDRCLCAMRSPRG